MPWLTKGYSIRQCVKDMLTVEKRRMWLTKYTLR